MERASIVQSPPGLASARGQSVEQGAPSTRPSGGPPGTLREISLPGPLAPRTVGLGCAACAEQGTVGSVALAELVAPAPSGAGVRPVGGSKLLTHRAHELVASGAVSLAGVKDLLLRTSRDGSA